MKNQRKNSGHKKSLLTSLVWLALAVGFVTAGMVSDREAVFAVTEQTASVQRFLREGEDPPTTVIPPSETTQTPTPETPTPETPTPEISTTETPTVTAPTNSVSPMPTETPQTKVNVQMNYLTGRAIFTAGSGGSSKFYLSTNKKRTWELLDLNTNSVDLNGLMKSSDVKIYFKGNRDQEPVELILKGEKKGLKAKYIVQNGVGKIDLTGMTGALEYRIGKDGNWADWSPATFATTPYEITGITLQFREKATVVERSGKVVNLKIPKRPTAPNVKVDGDKFVLTGMKADKMEYRLNSTNLNAPWITYHPADEKARYLDLNTLLLPANAPANTKIPSATIEIRTKATEKKSASAVRTIEIDAQESMPSTTNVVLNGTTLTCKDATSKNQYEYTMLHIGETLDMQKARWSTVRSDKPVRIKKTGKAETIPGDVLVIRKKLVKDPVTMEERLPSQYLTLQITSITPK